MVRRCWLVAQVETALLSTLEHMAARVSSVTGVEHLLLRLLSLPPSPLLPLVGDGRAGPTSNVCASSIARLHAAQACLRAVIVAEMVRPQLLACQYARHLDVLALSPAQLRSSMVVHRFYDVLAGWDGEPVDEEALETVLGLNADDETDVQDAATAGADAVDGVRATAVAAAGTRKRRIVDEVKEVSLFVRTAEEVVRLSSDVVGYVACRRSKLPRCRISQLCAVVAMAGLDSCASTPT